MTLRPSREVPCPLEGLGGGVRCGQGRVWWKKWGGGVGTRLLPVGERARQDEGGA